MTDRTLMMAILAIDAYYDREDGWQIGDATVTGVAPHAEVPALGVAIPE